MGRPKLQSDQSIDTQSSTNSANNQSSSTNSINHFSHPHPLQLSHHHSTIGNNSCSGCNLQVSGAIYTCTICNYFLHPKCSKMPQQITHPYDQNGHILSLLPKPAYPEGIFCCDACGEQGNRFCYHCKICGIDLHILCAESPMSLRKEFHQHQLELIFSPPYPGKTFTCDICRINGSNIWLYHCKICFFDVHLNCVNKLPNNHHFHQQSSFTQQSWNVMTARSNSVPASSNYFPESPHHPPTATSFNSFGHDVTGGFHGVGSPYVATRAPPSYGIPVNNFASTAAAGANIGPMKPTGTSGGGNGLLNQVVGGVANGIASGASQAIAGALIQGIMGGGGSSDGGGDAGNYGATY